MGYVVRMPQLGMSMEEGTVVEWCVAEGDAVSAGDPVAVVESEKTTADVEAREDGVLRRVLVPEGGTVDPGAPIGVLAGPEEDIDQYVTDLDVSADEDSSADAGSPGGSGETDGIQATPGARQRADDEDIDLGAVEGTGPQGVVTEDDVQRAAETGDRDDAADTGGADVRATPGARQRAEERGVDLAAVEGTGPQGVVTEEDVEAHAPADDARATRTVAEARPLSGMQRTISERLGESDRNAVHVTLKRSFDAGALTGTVATARNGGVEVSVVDLLLVAVRDALAAHPAFNAVFEDGEHRLIEEVNVGVAVDLDGGLVTPVVGDVADASAETVAARRRDLVERVRAGEFTEDDLAGGTFTVSNLGAFGVDHFDPVIDPPQVAILGVGRVREDDSMTLSLSFDHRVVNGADAARFLATLVEVATDADALEASFETALSAGAGRARPAGSATHGAGGAPTGRGARAVETRDVRAETTSGLSGSYAVEGDDTPIPFDEPTDAGGTGTAPTPVEHLLGALGSCLSLAVREMASRDDVSVDTIESAVDGTPDSGALERVAVTLTLESDAPDEDLDRVVTKAERACYVERALADDIDVSVTWTRAG